MKIQNTPFGSNPFKRSVAIITAALFLFTGLFIPVPSALATSNQVEVQGGGSAGSDTNVKFVPKPSLSIGGKDDLNRLVRDFEIRIPPELGSLDEIYRAPTEKNFPHLSSPQGRGIEGEGESLQSEVSSLKTVVYIQDAHDSLEAQENIAKLIQYLVANHSVKTVFEEGYEGPVPTDDYFGFIKDPKTRERVSYFLMDHLRIGGAEYAHINRAQEFQLIGADSIKLHQENIGQYRLSAAKKDMIAKDVKVLETELKTLVDRRFPNELKAWLKTKAQFDAKKLDLFTYLERTVPLLEGQTNAIRHREEPRKGDVAISVNKSEIASHLFSSNLKMKKTSAALASYKKFDENHAVAALPRNDTIFTPLLRFILEAVKSNDPVVIEKAKHIDAREVFEELNKLEQAISENYLQDAADRKLFEYDKILSLLNRLNELQVSQEEYETVKASLQAFDTDAFAKFIFSQAPKTLILSRMWEQNIKDAIRFYEIAKERDHSLSGTVDKYFLVNSGPNSNQSKQSGDWGRPNYHFEKGIKRLDGRRTEDSKNHARHSERSEESQRGLEFPGLARGETTKKDPSFSAGLRMTELNAERLTLSADTRTAVLVYGGFHKEAVKRILEAKGISYVVVSPKITKPSPRHEAFYKRLMTEGRLPFELSANLRIASRAETRFEMALQNPSLFRAELRTLADLSVQPDYANYSFAAEQAMKAFRSDPPNSIDGSVPGTARSEVRGHHLSREELLLLQEKDEPEIKDGTIRFISKRPFDPSRVTAQVLQLEKKLGHCDAAAKKKLQEILRYVDESQNFKNEEVHILSGTEPNAKVIGRIDRNIAEKFGYIHETSNVVLLTPDGKIVLQLRNKDNFDDHLAMYGGHLGVGESHTSSALAETSQEARLRRFKNKPEFMGYDSYSEPGDTNRERRSWFVLRLTSEEWKKMQRAQAAEDSEASVDRETQRRPRVKVGLEKLWPQGRGEVTTFLTATALEITNAKQARDEEAGGRRVHFLPVHETYQGREQTLLAFFTPDSLDRLFRNKKLWARVQKNIRSELRNDQPVSDDGTGTVSKIQWAVHYDDIPVAYIAAADVRQVSGLFEEMFGRFGPIREGHSEDMFSGRSSMILGDDLKTVTIGFAVNRKNRLHGFQMDHAKIQENMRARGAQGTFWLVTYELKQTGQPHELRFLPEDKKEGIELLRKKYMVFFRVIYEGLVKQYRKDVADEIKVLVPTTLWNGEMIKLTSTDTPTFKNAIAAFEKIGLWQSAEEMRDGVDPTPQIVEKVVMASIHIARDIHDGSYNLIFFSGRTGTLVHFLITQAWAALYPDEPIDKKAKVVRLHPDMSYDLYRASVEETDSEQPDRLMRGLTQRYGLTREQLEHSKIVFIDDFSALGNKIGVINDTFKRLKLNIHFSLLGGEEIPGRYSINVSVGNQDPDVREFFKKHRAELNSLPIDRNSTSLTLLDPQLEVIFSKAFVEFKGKTLRSEVRASQTIERQQSAATGDTGAVSTVTSFELLDPQRMFEKDEDMRAAVEYFNNEVIGSKADLTWEQVIHLYELLRGDLRNPAYQLQSLERTLRLTFPGRGKVLKEVNRKLTVSEDAIYAAVDFYKGFVEGQSLAWKSGFDRTLDQSRLGDGSNHPSQGHHRLAWFLMNFILIRNGYLPFYFQNAVEYKRSIKIGGSNFVNRKLFLELVLQRCASSLPHDHRSEVRGVRDHLQMLVLSGILASGIMGWASERSEVVKAPRSVASESKQNAKPLNLGSEAEAIKKFKGILAGKFDFQDGWEKKSGARKINAFFSLRQSDPDIFRMVAAAIFVEEWNRAVGNAERLQELIPAASLVHPKLAFFDSATKSWKGYLADYAKGANGAERLAVVRTIQKEILGPAGIGVTYEERFKKIYGETTVLPEFRLTSFSAQTAADIRRVQIAHEGSEHVLWLLTDVNPLQRKIGGGLLGFMDSADWGLLEGAAGLAQDGMDTILFSGRNMSSFAAQQREMLEASFKTEEPRIVGWAMDRYAPFDSLKEKWPTEYSQAMERLKRLQKVLKKLYLHDYYQHSALASQEQIFFDNRTRTVAHEWDHAMNDVFGYPEKDRKELPSELAGLEATPAIHASLAEFAYDVGERSLNNFELLPDYFLQSAEAIQMVYRLACDQGLITKNEELYRLNLRMEKPDLLTPEDAWKWNTKGERLEVLSGWLEALDTLDGNLLHKLSQEVYLSHHQHAPWRNVLERADITTPVLDSLKNKMLRIVDSITQKSKPSLAPLMDIFYIEEILGQNRMLADQASAMIEESFFNSLLSIYGPETSEGKKLHQFNIGERDGNWRYDRNQEIEKRVIELSKKGGRQSRELLMRMAHDLKAAIQSHQAPKLFPSTHRSEVRGSAETGFLPGAVKDSLALHRGFRQRGGIGSHLPAQRSFDIGGRRALPIFLRSPGFSLPGGKDGAGLRQAVESVYRFSFGYGAAGLDKIFERIRRLVSSLLKVFDEVVRGTISDHPSQLFVLADGLFLGLPVIGPEIFLSGIRERVGLQEQGKLYDKLLFAGIQPLQDTRQLYGHFARRFDHILKYISSLNSNQGVRPEFRPERPEHRDDASATPETDRRFNQARSESRGVNKMKMRSKSTAKGVSISRSADAWASLKETTKERIEWDRVDSEFEKWMASGGMDSEDVKILVQILLGGEVALAELLETHKNDQKVSVKAQDAQNMWKNGSTVYLTLTTPFPSSAGNIAVLRIKGVRPRTSTRGKEIDPHVGDGMVDFEPRVSSRGNLTLYRWDLYKKNSMIPNPDSLDPQGTMLKEDAQLEDFLMQEGQKGEGFETDYPITLCFWKDVTYVGNQTGFVIAGMRSKDIRLRKFLRNWEFDINKLLYDVQSDDSLTTDRTVRKKIYKSIGKALRAYHDAGYFHRFPHNENWGVEIDPEAQVRIIVRDLNTTLSRIQLKGRYSKRQEIAYRLIDFAKVLSEIGHGVRLASNEKKRAVLPLIKSFLEGYFYDTLLTPKEFSALIESAMNASDTDLIRQLSMNRGTKIILNSNTPIYGSIWDRLFGLVSDRTLNEKKISLGGESPSVGVTKKVIKGKGWDDKKKVSDATPPARHPSSRISKTNLRSVRAEMRAVRLEQKASADDPLSFHLPLVAPGAAVGSRVAHPKLRSEVRGDGRDGVSASKRVGVTAVERGGEGVASLLRNADPLSQTSRGEVRDKKSDDRQRPTNSNQTTIARSEVLTTEVSVLGAKFQVKPEIYDRIEVLSLETLQGNDIKELIELQRRLVERGYISPNALWYRERIESILRDGDGADSVIAVYRRKGRIAGYVYGTKFRGVESRIGQISDIGVSEGSEGEGIGTNLLAFGIQDLAIRKSAKRIWLWARAPEIREIIKRAGGFFNGHEEDFRFLKEPDDKADGSWDTMSIKTVEPASGESQARAEVKGAISEKSKALSAQLSFSAQDAVLTAQDSGLNPSRIFKLDRDVVFVMPRSEIGALTAPEMRELVLLVGLNKKLHIMIPEGFVAEDPKTAARIEELQRIGSIHSSFAEVAHLGNAPVIGFGDRDGLRASELAKTWDPELARRIQFYWGLKHFAEKPESQNAFGVPLLAAIGDIPRQSLKEQNGFLYDGEGRWSSQVLEWAEAYTVISTSA